jgi:hypothetical protein
VRVAVASVGVAVMAIVSCAASERGPFLAIGTPVASSAVVRDSERVATVGIALQSLSEGDLARLDGILARARERAYAHANPLYVELEDDRPDDLAREARSLLESNAPILTAAQAIGRTRFELSDGFSVALVSDCRASAPTDCVPLWGAPSERLLERRMRFAAWPLAFAGVLATRGVANDPASALRPLIHRRDGTVALVLTLAPARDGSGARAAIRQRMRRILPRLEHDHVDTRWARAVATTEPSTNLDHVGIQADEILVVPRLGALARLRAFEREISTELGRLRLADRVRWIRRPSEQK